MSDELRLPESVQAVSLKTKEEWLAIREHGVGASEVPSLFAAEIAACDEPAPFMSEFELYAGMEDIFNAYQQGTSADTTRLFNQAGAFGGSAHLKAINNNENALAKQLGNYANQMYSQQYDRAAGLESEDINRQLQAIPLAQQGQNLSFDAYRQLMGAGDFNRSVRRSRILITTIRTGAIARTTGATPWIG